MRTFHENKKRDSIDVVYRYDQISLFISLCFVFFFFFLALLLLPLPLTTTTKGALRRRDHNRGDRSILFAYYFFSSFSKMLHFQKTFSPKEKRCAQIERRRKDTKKEERRKKEKRRCLS